MYEIRIRNGDQTETLHELDVNSIRRVTSCTFEEEINAIPYAAFTVTPQNPAYDHMHELTTHVEIVNTHTGEIEFEGRILQKPKDSMEKSGIVTRQFTCEGFLAYLCDSRQMYQNDPDSEPGQFLNRLQIETNENNYDVISLNCGDWHLELSPLNVSLSNNGTGKKVLFQSGGIWWYDQGNEIFSMHPSGVVSIWDGGNWVNTNLTKIESNYVLLAETCNALSDQINSLQARVGILERKVE